MSLLNHHGEWPSPTGMSHCPTLPFCHPDLNSDVGIVFPFTSKESSGSQKLAGRPPGFESLGFRPVVLIIRGISGSPVSLRAAWLLSCSVLHIFSFQRLGGWGVGLHRPWLLCLENVSVPRWSLASPVLALIGGSLEPALHFVWLSKAGKRLLTSLTSAVGIKPCRGRTAGSSTLLSDLTGLQSF